MIKFNSHSILHQINHVHLEPHHVIVKRETFEPLRIEVFYDQSVRNLPPEKFSVINVSGNNPKRFLYSLICMITILGLCSTTWPAKCLLCSFFFSFFLPFLFSFSLFFHFPFHSLLDSFSIGYHSSSSLGLLEASFDG